MNIKLLGYSISLNIIILIGIFYLIIVVNALSGSCKREGFTKAELMLKKQLDQKSSTVAQSKGPITMSDNEKIIIMFDKAIDSAVSSESAIRNLIANVRNQIRGIVIK